MAYTIIELTHLMAVLGNVRHEYNVRHKHEEHLNSTIESIQMYREADTNYGDAVTFMVWGVEDGKTRLLAEMRTDLYFAITRSGVIYSDDNPVGKRQ